MICPLISNAAFKHGSPEIHWADCREQDCPWWLPISRHCSINTLAIELSAIEQHLNIISAANIH